MVKILISVIAIFMAAGISYLQYLSFKKHKRLEEKNEDLKREYIENQRTYKENVFENENLRKLRHDFNKQVNLLEAGNGDIASTLALKKKCMDEKGIRNNLGDIVVSEILSFEKALGITQIEIANVLLNLIDNGIEACDRIVDASGVEEIGEVNDRFVLVTIMNDEGANRLVITNSKATSENLKSSGEATVKEDKRAHGLGLKNIRDIVEKAGGRIVVKDLGDEFYVELGR